MCVFLCVCVTTLQSFHSYRFHFHCSMLFAVLFAFLCVLFCSSSSLFYLPCALFFARKFLYNCALSALELYRLQNVFIWLLFALCVFFSWCVYMCMLYEKYIYIYIVYVNKQFTHSTGIRFAPIASYCCVCMCLSACMLFYRSGMGHFFPIVSVVIAHTFTKILSHRRVCLK